MTINDDITKLELTEGVREAGQYVRAHELKHALRAEITAPEEVWRLQPLSLEPLTLDPRPLPPNHARCTLVSQL
jgi:hypothetical protein